MNGSRKIWGPRFGYRVGALENWLTLFCAAEAGDVKKLYGSYEHFHTKSMGNFSGWWLTPFLGALVARAAACYFARSCQS